MKPAMNDDCLSAMDVGCRPMIDTQMRSDRRRERPFSDCRNGGGDGGVLISEATAVALAKSFRYAQQSDVFKNHTGDDLEQLLFIVREIEMIEDQVGGRLVDPDAEVFS